MTYRLLGPVFACLVVLVAGCAPGAQNPRTDGPSATSSAPKILRMGIRAGDEPQTASGGIAYNNEEPGLIFHSALVAYDPTTSVLETRIAERVPTVENGDWRLSPDGTMEVTWKMRPNVLWHDGTPLEAGDFVFGLKVGMDGDVFARATGVLRSISDITAPDPQTLVVKWKNVYIYANAMVKDTLVPAPRHLFQDLYDSGDKRALAASPYWTTQFTGVGPYRLEQWIQGSSMEAVAYDQYFLGRPKIDRISIRYVGDVNTLLVTVMAGDVDVVPGGAFKQEEGHVLKTEWEARGSGTVLVNYMDLRHGKPIWRYPDAPWVQDVRVRQALVHMLDRQGMVDTLKYGLSAVADVPLLPENPAYRLAQQRGLPSYPYDVTRAQRLLTEAGYTRGADGIFRSQSGERFTIEAAATADIASQVQELVVIADHWRAGGLDATSFPVPDLSADKDELRSKARGIVVKGLDLDYTGFQEFTVAETSSEATRWKGRNLGAYVNPAYDQQVSRLLAAVQGSEREQAGADLIKMALEEVVWIPLFYGADIVAARTGIRGVTKAIPAQDITSWNVHLWDIQ